METTLHSQLMDLLQTSHLGLEDCRKRLDELKRTNPTHEVFRDFFYLLTHLDVSENKAREHWVNLVEHHGQLENKLGGPVDVRVSALNYFIHVVREIENPKIMEMRVFLNNQSQILKDELTGLYNYRHFKETLPSELQRAHGASSSLALVMVDVDDFKKVNDEQGHLIGDRVLAKISALIVQNVGSSGTCYRYGGEELAILLPGYDKKRAYMLAEEIRKKVEKNAFVIESRSDGRGATLNLTASLGVACYPSDADHPEALMHHADKALYTAKGSGKNKVAMYSENLRRHHRYPLQLDGKVAILGQSTLSAKVTDISQSGVGFMSEARLTRGDTIALDIKIDGLNHEVRLVARVIFVARDKNPAVYGAEFVSHSDETRLNIQNLIRSVKKN